MNQTDDTMKSRVHTLLTPCEGDITNCHCITHHPHHHPSLPLTGHSISVCDAPSSIITPTILPTAIHPVTHHPLISTTTSSPSPSLSLHTPSLSRPSCPKMWLYLMLICVLLPSTWSAVPSPPTMIKQPPHEQLYQISAGSDEPEKPFMLECEATGFPEPKYRWIKNGAEFDYVAYDKRISQQPRRGTLVFTKPDHVDEGLYQCFAENTHGVSVSNAVFLRKSELNSFPDQDIPSQITVPEGQPFSLECSPPTGYPKPAIFWIILSNLGALRSINSSRLTVDPEGTLNFSNVTHDDALEDGMYACSATSFFRTEYKIGKKVHLRVESSGSSGQFSHPPTKQYFSPPTIPSLRGQRLELHCIVGGTPLPDITWIKRGGKLEGSRQYSITNYGKTLVINPVDFQDQGTYECTASNGIGSQLSNAMNVQVSASPYWNKSPNNTNAAEDEDVKFTCNAGGDPDPKLQWLVNGVPIEKAPVNSRRKIEGNTLTIKSLVKQDTAVYQCNSSNVHGYAYKDFYINVLSMPPEIVDKPEPFTRAVVTSVVTLTCRVFGAPKPTVRWYKNTIELTGGRYQIMDSGDLRISDVIVTDQGEYTCRAQNKFDSVEAKGELQIKMKTKVTHPPENVEVAAGKIAVFRCTAEADPSVDMTIEWLFNNKPLDFDQLQRIQQSADNSLSIGSAIELDSGAYTCVARTDLDEATATATLIVQDVPNPPTIQGIECDVLAAMVEWAPNGDRRAPILSYSIQYNTSFSPDVWEDAFVNIPAPDNRFKVSMSPWANYTFRVVARNKIGPSLPSLPSDRCSTDEDVPHKNPEKVVGRGTSPHNLVITWAPMPLIEHNAPNFFYKVYYKRNDLPDQKWMTRQIDDWRQNKMVIPGQETFKQFRIKVEAHNKRGQSHTTATEVIGYSGEDRPSQSPRNFRHVDTRDAKTALFSWDPVDPNSIHGHFKGYKIETWSEDDSDDAKREIMIPPEQARAVADILKPYAKNYVQVYAFNEMYNGPPSERIEVVTPEGIPGPVTMFEAIPMGSSSFYLRWNKPSEINGVLRGYNIYYEEVHGTQLGTKMERKPAINDPTAIRAKLVGLKPATKYRITIQARTNKGEGDPYFIEDITRGDEDTVPGTPRMEWFKIPEDEGKSGVRVTWLPAIEGDNPGSHFYVQFRRRGETHFESSQVEEENDYILVNGLDPQATYDFRVIAVDGKHQTASALVEINAGSLGNLPFATESTDHLDKADWLVGLISAIAFILVIAVLVCVVKRNRGGKYAVAEKEITRGRGLDFDHDGFDEYSKGHDIRGSQPMRGSRMSPNSSIRGLDDEGSVIDYGEDDSKFGEDGSFIGQYRTKKLGGEAPVSHAQGAATFV